MSISRRLRYEILRRDDHACRYCGDRAPDVKLTVDHVIPIALGGTDEPSNLVTACQPCNAGKSASAPDAPIVEGVKDDALRWSAAMNEAAAIQAKRREERNAFIEAFDTAWLRWRTENGEGDLLPRPDSWKDSVGRLFDFGLEFEVVAEAIDSAMRRRTWGDHGEFKYFCGICWGILRERQEMAGEIMHGPEDIDG